MSADQEPLVVEAFHRLEETAKEGESEETPLVLFGGVWVVVAITVLALTSLALIAYRIAET